MLTAAPAFYTQWPSSSFRNTRALLIRNTLARIRQGFANSLPIARQPLAARRSITKNVILIHNHIALIPEPATSSANRHQHLTVCIHPSVEFPWPVRIRAAAHTASLVEARARHDAEVDGDSRALRLIGSRVVHALGTPKADHLQRGVRQ